MAGFPDNRTKKTSGYVTDLPPRQHASSAAGFRCVTSGVLGVRPLVTAAIVHTFTVTQRQTHVVTNHRQYKMFQFVLSGHQVVSRQQ